MATVTPSHVVTGHTGIDAQHVRLALMVERLASICAQGKTGNQCRQCPDEHQDHCGKGLAELLSDLIAFMLDHFIYEENLMLLLPDTEDASRHVMLHKHAHAEVSRHLSEVALNLQGKNPVDSALELQQVIGLWLGNHNQLFDTPLAAKLRLDHEAEVGYDRELVELLNRHAMSFQ